MEENKVGLMRELLQRSFLVTVAGVVLFLYLVSWAFFWWGIWFPFGTIFLFLSSPVLYTAFSLQVFRFMPHQIGLSSDWVIKIGSNAMLIPSWVAVGFYMFLSIALSLLVVGILFFIIRKFCSRRHLLVLSLLLVAFFMVGGWIEQKTCARGDQLIYVADGSVEWRYTGNPPQVAQRWFEFTHGLGNIATEKIDGVEWHKVVVKESERSALVCALASYNSKMGVMVLQ